MSTTMSPIAAARDALGSFGERLVGPDDGTYDEARALFNAMFDKRPALDRALRRRRTTSPR